MADEFLNPYTFIQAFPRERLPQPLQDGPPPSRARLRPGCWTGRIEVTVTAETPLLLLDTARADRLPGDGHEVFPVRLRDGRPHLPATSVKGMLRAAYEAVTNSRLGVFDGHDVPLGFRRDAGYALGMVPVLVGSSGVCYAFQQASLRMYEKKSGDSVYPRDGQEAPRHLERLRAVIKGGNRGPTEVVRFVRKSSPEVLRPGNGEGVVEGLAFVTGPNIDGKTCERLFYVDGDAPRKLELARPWNEIETRWDILIENYERAHDDAELFGRKGPDGTVVAPSARLGDTPGRLAWSPHLYEKERKELKGGRLCYARLVNGRVDRLYPVLVPRDLHSVAPADLLPRSLAPASCYDELSPADRVFGWVAPQGSGVRPAAYRGRLRIGPVVCDQDADESVERFDGDGLPIAILGGPKPQQGRFYLAESADRPDRPIPGGAPKEKLYQAGRGLRGRKVYWHHAGLDRRQHWSEGQGKLDPTQVRVGRHYREFRRPRSSLDDSGSLTPDRKRYQTTDVEQRDTQNRSIKGWVRPGTTFRFSVEVRDLDDVELGALAWLLSLPAGHFHRLGYGRPLGFGSVRLDVDTAELHAGEQFADYYRSLSGSLPDEDGTEVLARVREEFVRLIEGSEELSTVRTALLAAARGNPELPVHYPRTRPDRLLGGIPAPPDPRGQNYTWFTENERVEGEKVASGRGRSLPAPVDADPLVVYPDKNGKAGEEQRGTGKSTNRNKSARSSGVTKKRRQ
ncbi:TIGR03986 family type III CRISPR-associated RAMP protein [Nonomuraea cavernae]|uniref:TIGR03986 family CRISPR-associated RAMP protein n=1 Tax=Nonomuraea cavernae TaxID=2045107 RepID=A0A917Z133_9ACTN|nr:TIGR03986 family CRISPR-associated RAMP protein [Nonomuraea cavernae]MCA2186462.1 TIGR03986 family CRISPR-associated RAMP protein [Nonomuraea cavernae]GGO71155.1 hypothetical protein GCM10012289_36220 [Nonomuraea cavernae]